ncbi:MAG: toll/interleukin-1 receptor domain-containing protein [Vicinamibacteria bacterium]|nr:toll/interleukin-1 receptor domain-containing protein [Vicinamibacteria bacterium]
MTNGTPTEELQRRLAEGERDFQGESLSGANLRGADLRGANLRGANLRGANLHGADFREAKLIRTDLGMADLGMTDFGAADLNGADFRGANLKGANFAGAILDGANLRGADLQGADLRGAKLVRADLSRASLGLADISHSELRGADLRGADLAGANLKNASLQSATLHGADLRRADFTGANLRGANLTDARIEEAVLTNSTAGSTVFADLDLRRTEGLETLYHTAPSTLGTDTLSRSLGEIPEAFLRGCGLSSWEILAAKEHDPSLTTAQVEELQGRVLKARAGARFPRKRILISYSQPDAPFVDAIREHLLARGIFTWMAPHEPNGTFRERQSRLPIQHDLTFLLVLSEDTVKSDWAEHELRLVRKLEKSLGEEILCPVSLDDAWKATSFHGRIVEKTTEDRVLSFADWQNQTSLEKQCDALLEGLALFHPGPSPG